MWALYLNKANHLKDLERPLESMNCQCGAEMHCSDELQNITWYTKMLHYKTLFTHIGGWIHHQATLYGLNLS